VRVGVGSGPAGASVPVRGAADSPPGGSTRSPLLPPPGPPHPVLRRSIRGCTRTGTDRRTASWGATRWWPSPSRPRSHPSNHHEAAPIRCSGWCRTRCVRSTNGSRAAGACAATGTRAVARAWPNADSSRPVPGDAGIRRTRRHGTA